MDDGRLECALSSGVVELRLVQALSPRGCGEGDEQVAAKDQHADHERWGQQQGYHAGQFRRNPEICEPGTEHGKRHKHQLDEIQSRPPPQLTGQLEKQGESERRQDQRHRQEPFDPVVEHEIVTSLQDIKG